MCPSPSGAKRRHRRKGRYPPAASLKCSITMYRFLAVALSLIFERITLPAGERVLRGSSDATYPEEMSLLCSIFNNSRRLPALTPWHLLIHTENRSCRLYGHFPRI